MLLKDFNNLPEFIFKGKQFVRREDLTESIRSYIAVILHLLVIIIKTPSRSL
ncbi:hypothetical protein MTBBW1_2380046 [Desulfamplus magnetovallimortis]|uniref:Uncharacterized protein n=1 Tax=Desulfamplus magnetovallimortis TaxID=1246637 RepID=A0A1W1HEB5_9BACT|nr:hypothetical protein MTBBW1_2380046 [Desulfamplus magnetovallimortis]